MKKYIFWGELTGISAKKEALYPTPHPLEVVLMSV